MSEARGVANDLWRVRAPHRFPLWRRRPAVGASNGGALYGRLLSSFNSMRQYVRASDRGAELAERLSGVSDKELEAEMRAAVRAVRRSNFSLDSLEDYAAALSEAAVRADVLAARTSDVRSAAAHMLLGRNVCLPGERARVDALAVAACGAAMLGERIHVISEDDERARRLYDAFTPLYRRLGLSAGFADGAAAVDKRSREYGARIVHAGATTLAADYLTDLEFAGVDGLSLRATINVLTDRTVEAKRIIFNNASWLFVDEGDVTLGNSAMRMVTIAGEKEFFEQTQFVSEAIEFARLFSKGSDFVIEGGALELTERGATKAAAAAERFSPLWSGERRRSETLHAALVALHVYRRGVDYRVEERRVAPVNPELGAAMRAGADDELSIGLLLAAKEELLDSKDKRVRRRTNVRSVLQRYHRKSSISCPGASMAGELWSGLGMQTIDIRPFFSKRMIDAAIIADTGKGKTAAAARLLAAERNAGVGCVLIARPADIEAIKALTQKKLRQREAVQYILDIPFDDRVVERIGSIAEPSNAVIAHLGDDETWRRIVHALRLRSDKCRISFALEKGDPVFESLPQWFRPGRAGRATRTRGLLARIFCHAALNARRSFFVKYRIAHNAHDKTTNRVLAFMGGA